MSNYSDGRMIRKDISKSMKFSSLSKDAMVLFQMLIPHYDSHGKMNGNPHYIKGEICPLIDFLTPKVIESCLEEISEKTSVKWFSSGGLHYLHALSFSEHQDLNPGRIGKDKLPNYQKNNSRENQNELMSNSAITHEKVQHQIEEEVEVQIEVKEEVKEEINTNTAASKNDAAARVNKNGSYLFKNSPFFDYKVFREHFPKWTEEETRQVYEEMSDWSASKGMKRFDWIATARGWYRRSKSGDKSNGQYTYKSRMDKLREQSEKAGQEVLERFQRTGKL